MPVVSEPSRVGRALRQMPNGLTPNFTHGLAALILAFISWISRLMLSRRQSALVGEAPAVRGERGVVRHLVVPLGYG